MQYSVWPMLLVVVLAVACFADPAPNGFWVSIELQQIEWTPRRIDCINEITKCSSPRLTIVEELHSRSEKVFSWPLLFRELSNNSETSSVPSSQSVVSYWQDDHPENLSISCRVTGMVPVFRIPAICDQTNTQPIISETRKLRRFPMEGETKMQVIARCFNVTLSIRLYVDRCPWCPEHSMIDIIETTESSFTASLMIGNWKGDIHPLHLAIFALVLYAMLISLILFCLVIRGHIYQRKETPSTTAGTLYRRQHEEVYDQPFEPSSLHMRSMGYKMTLPDCARGECNIASPADSASSLGYGSANGSARCAPPTLPAPDPPIYYQITGHRTASPFKGMHI